MLLPLMTETKTPQRVAKLIAASGLCSRRDAEAWIAEGRVFRWRVLDTHRRSTIQAINC